MDEQKTIEQIETLLRRLPPENLATVLDYASYLVERQRAASGAFQTMLASEAVLRRDWDTAEEDGAWAHL